MELVGQQSTFEACNLLGVPGISCLDVDDDEGDIVIGIRPKSSPQPRRRTSVDDDDSEPEPPLSSSRRVSFADAKGLNLVQVKEFALWDVPKLPGYDSSEGEGNDAEEYFLSPLTFSRPLLTEELFSNVQKQKVELETLQLLPGTSILKGVIRVLNISFDKAVFIRTTLDSWSSHFDLLAEYIPGSSDGVTDCFSFKLTLVPPSGQQGARIDFCLRYETPMGIFWANNNDRNYALHCYHRTKEEKQKPQKKSTNKKSCLKTASQNFSVENISGKEDSSLDSISTDVSSQTSTMETINVCNGQSSGSEGEKQRLLVEDRQNSSRKSRRKAARMARVRTYFAQRNGGVTDNERDESPPEIKQAAPNESPGDKHTDVQAVLEENKSEVIQPLKREPLIDNTSLPQNVIFNIESVKPESIASLTGCENESEIKDNLVHSDNEPASPKQQNIKEIVSKVEESSQNQDKCCERMNSIAAVSSESLVSHSDFTFETVVAPLYQQVFGRVGSESQSIADWGNSVCAVQAIGDSDPHRERRQSSNTNQTEATCKDGNIGKNVVDNRELNHKSLDYTPSNAKENDQANLSVTLNCVLGCEDDPLEIDSEPESEGPKPPLGFPKPGNMFVSKDLSNPQIPLENSDLQGEAAKKNQTHDPQSQTTADSLQLQLPEHICTPTKTNQDEIQEVNISPPSSSISLPPCQTVPGHIIEETGQEMSSRGEINCTREELDQGHYSLPTTKKNTALKEDNMFDILDDFNSNHNDTPVITETESSSLSGCEYVKDITTSKTSLETHGETNNMERESHQMHSLDKEETKHLTGINGMTEVVGYEAKALLGKEDRDGDFMFLGPYDKETIEDPTMAAVPNQDDDVCSTNITEAKNWEAMVEEEEYSVIISEEDIETTKAEDVETMEEVTAEEQNEEKVEEIMWEIKVKEVKEDKIMGLEDKVLIRKEEIVKTDDKTELDYIQMTTAETVEEEKLTKENDVEKTEEQGEEQLEKEEHFSDTADIIFASEKMDERKETTQIELNNEGKAGDELEEELKPKEEKELQAGLDYTEEMIMSSICAPARKRKKEKARRGRKRVPVVEAPEMDIKDEDTWMTTENGKHEEESFEKKLEITQNNVEDGSSAVVINGQESISESVTDKEYEREGISTDEWENDQTGHESTSAESEVSDSDDEVELYMHCLRAVSTGAQAQKERNNETGLTMSKRPSISRSKPLSTPMPSITESLDEDQPLGGLQENHEDLTTAFSAVLTASSGQESINRNTSEWWRGIFSCGNISKTLLYTTLLVVFLVVAYHYDFLACFGLYLISAVWLCCQGERQPAKNNRIGRNKH